MATALTGIFASGVAWLAGVLLARRRIATIATALPREWLEHDVVGPAYRELRPAGRREVVAWLPRMAPYLAGTFAFFVVLDVVGTRLVVQLIACATLAGMNTASSVEVQRRGVAALVEEHGLPQVPRSRRRRLGYVGTTFLSSLGFTGTACFLARLLFAAI